MKDKKKINYWQQFKIQLIFTYNTYLRAYPNGEDPYPGFCLGFQLSILSWSVLWPISGFYK